MALEIRPVRLGCELLQSRNLRFREQIDLALAHAKGPKGAEYEDSHPQPRRSGRTHADV